ncbi:MAG: NAD+ synthase [Actinobacteria bacterium]|nr:NAD+ synthase [Actinomycetota bacterium]
MLLIHALPSLLANRLVLVLPIRLAFGQTNPIVGDFAGNLDQIETLCVEAEQKQVDLLIFGELALCGYPLGDLSYRRDLVLKSETALETLLAKSKDFPNLTLLVGYARLATQTNPSQSSKAIAHNSAAAIRNGELLGVYDKQLLPNYDVFDDWRNFVPGTQELNIKVGQTVVAVKICEDIWSEAPFADDQVDLIAVLNGSPFTFEKSSQRRVAAKRFAAGKALAYANLAGGQDELVFDGDSFVVGADGSIRFTAGMQPGLFIAEEGQDGSYSAEEKLFQVLVAGLRDYLAKTKQTRVVLGLSGGIDSALCAALAVEAIGMQNVLGVSMPSRYSSEHSVSDAVALARNLGIELRSVPIEPAHLAFESMLTLSDLAQENLQARLRAVILMGISNSEGRLLLTTGNKSEVAVGYSTIYGDSAGGFAPIKDLLKTDVWRMARYVNKRAATELIPVSSIEKPPSAELRPGQLDQDSLPDYEILDGIIRILVEANGTVQDAIAAGFSTELVHKTDRMIRAAEWKRSQGAIGTKLSGVSFGSGRRVPITTRFD